MNNHPVYTDNDPQKETITLNLGPTHPATHGVFQNVLELDGERIVSGVSTIGYIHRAFEKIAEHRPFYQITPLTDRLNYCSSPINNMGWHMTVEKLLNIQTPKRVDYLRVIIMELSRISDHLICNGILGVDTGAFTGFLYLMEEREHIYEIFEISERVKAQKYKGRKIPGKYLTKNPSKMKKEIDTFRGKKEYKKDWDADYTSGKGGKGKRVKTKKSAATKAYQRMFGDK
jgi:NADH:ubiquinone oxidoreductase subunit D